MATNNSSIAVTEAQFNLQTGLWNAFVLAYNLNPNNPPNTCPITIPIIGGVGISTAIINALLSTVGTENISGFRFYGGLSSYANTCNTSTPFPSFLLTFVAVDMNGNDILFNSNGVSLIFQSQIILGSYTADHNPIVLSNPTITNPIPLLSAGANNAYWRNFISTGISLGNKQLNAFFVPLVSITTLITAMANPNSIIGLYFAVTSNMISPFTLLITGLIPSTGGTFIFAKNAAGNINVTGPALTCPPFSSKSNFLNTNPPVDSSLAFSHTQNWRDSFSANTGQINGFYISREDLMSVLSVSPSGQGLRIYSALDAPLAFKTHHMYVVAVDANGNDIISDAFTNQSAIFDFTAPCPLCCGGGNSLNGLPPGN